jgi:DNA-binding CsgD family transcriptional regulator
VPPLVRGNALLTVGVIAYLVGDYRGARTRFEQATAYWRGLGDRVGLGATLGYYGRTMAATAETPAEYERGKALMHEAIALNREAGTLWWAGDAMLSLGISAWEHAELDLAAAILGEAAAINTQLGDSHAQSHLASRLGAVRRDQGDLVGAERLIKQSLAESRAITCLGGTAQALYFLAGLTRLRGDRVVAAQQAVEGLQLHYRVGDIAQLLNCVELLGGLACEQALPVRTARLLSSAAAIRQNTGVPMPPILQPAYERDLATARGALGKDRFTAAWAEGSAMTIDQLVEYACETDAAVSQPHPSPTDPLSQRERQVVALLARGYTNRQIAEKLIISGRTADGHVANILAKLGLSTRAQAAVWAVEHQHAEIQI